jgi:hypothetical protein
MRKGPADPWESCDETLNTATVPFEGNEVEVVASAPGFIPSTARIGEGPTTLILRAAPKTMLHARVAQFPAGVEAGVAWSVWVTFLRPCPIAGGVEPPLPRRLTDQWRIVDQSHLDIALFDQGVYEVTLVGGVYENALTYGTRQVETGSGGSITLDLAVDPKSEGMRALTTGIGW